MRQDCRGVSDKFGAEFSHRTIRRHVFRVNRDRLRAHASEQFRGIQRITFVEHATHSIDRPRKIYRSGPGGFQSLRDDREAFFRLRTRGTLDSERDTHRCRDANRRRAANHHRADSLRDAAIVAIGTNHLARGQQALIDHANGIRPPFYRHHRHVV